eukprot:CAMPEP_0197188646 /NCGR_PEP_ID=MMETSP1423-20130617/18199_1 /TAXON_ID=476441 /ORGANISM="Pseudo-nitzschia heimii, Strain UNC1101" /LENGTH=290 /DNA_ID=CAMNT_0042640537 /DNA_START=42 /DNA_END=914 /DNA_ORIENTATION=+
MSKEEIEASHKKALKSLEGEKRAALKKAKGMKGKKGKEALAAVENDFASRLKALDDSYQANLLTLATESLEVSNESATDAGKISASSDGDDESNIVDEELAARERKLAKAKKKRDRLKEKEAQIQQQIEEENANAGPGLRKIELEQIQAVLTPRQLKVIEVEADGHCLYRAVGAQTGRTYTAIRSLCADTLLKHQDDFAPFCEYTDDVSSFEQYVHQVRDTAEWGGHLELRALGIALNRPIYVYSVQSGTKPLAIHGASDGNQADKEPILLSYHLHYYALGEHYNQVIKE